MEHCLFVLGLVCVAAAVASSEISPVTVVEGNPYILVIYDFHQEIASDGQCSKLSRRSVDALMALKWSNEALNRNTQHNIGFLLYDSCGSLRRTLQIVGQYINKCDNSTEIAGVVTLTRKEIQTTVESFLQPFGIVHVGISSNSFITRGTGLSLSVAGVSMWKPQAVLQLVEEFNWKHINVFAVDNPLAQTERELFLRMSATNGICAVSLEETNIQTAMTNMSTLNAIVVLFVTGYHELNTITSNLVMYPDKTFLLVGDSNFDNIKSSPGNNTFFLREQAPVMNNMYEYLQQKFTVFNDSDPITSEFISSLPYCEYDQTFEHTICNGTMMQYWKSRLQDRIFLNVIAAYYNIFRIISRSQTFGCSGFDLTKCPQAVDFVAVNVQQNPNGFPVETYELNNGKVVEEQFPVILSQGPESTAEIATVTNDTVVYSSNKKDIKTRMPPSECSISCLNCGVCFQKREDPVPVVLGQDGDIILTAGFPIYRDSEFGQSCSELSPEGVIMTQSFIYAVETVKDKYTSKSLLQGVSIGTLIFDTCGGKTLESLQILRNSNCPPTFFDGRNNITLSGNMVSNIEYDKSLYTKDQEHSSADTAKFLVSLSGLMRSPVTYVNYIDALESVLKQMNWTYISVIYSEEMVKVEKLSTRISSLRKSGICISEEIIIKQDMYDIDLVASHVSNGTLKTGAIILLTSEEDTRRLVQSLHKELFSFKNINLVFFPWNYIPDTPKGSVIIRPKHSPNPSLNYEIKTLSVLDNSYFRGPLTESVNQWWIKYHEIRHKCHVTINDNTIYPNPCTNQPTFSDMADIDMTVPNLIVDYVDTIVSIIDRLHKATCISQPGACEAFKSYTEFGTYLRMTVPDYTFEDGTENRSFSTDGTLKLPLDVWNKRMSSEIKVGEISEDNQITLWKNQVFAYDVNDNPVTLQHQCSGWCPSCHQCQTTATQSIDYLYIPGDFDILGMFSIHKEGSKAGTCGPLALNTGTDYLTESFLYAVHTAKARYPYLLPGISAGSLIVDTCSSIDTAQQSISNFESCFASFKSEKGMMATPMSVPAYLLHAGDNIANSIKLSVQRHGKLAVSQTTDPKDMNTVDGKLQYSYAQSETRVIINFLSNMDWTYVSVVSSSSVEYSQRASLFQEYAKDNNICIYSHHVVSDPLTMSSAFKDLSSSPTNVVILFLSVKDVKLFFSTKTLQKVYIIGDTNVIWGTAGVNIQIPLGSIIIDRIDKINSGLNTYLDTISMQKLSQYGNPWIRSFITERESCQSNQAQACTVPHDVLIQSSSTVLEIDLILHALHKKIIKICGHNAGICKLFENTGFSLSNEDFKNINFTYQQNEIKMSTDPSQNGEYQISNFQGNTIMKVGEWRNNTLSLSKEQIRAYSIGGVALNDLPVSRCIGTCLCINLNDTEDSPSTASPYLDPEFQFFSSSAKFNNELWVIVVLAIACGGVAASMLFVIYVVYKTCVGLLNKRYIGLGILLLGGIMALYLSVLPFMFTPSENVCAARYLLPGITYAFVYATCLTKLMSLRSYKYIGLGGEISNLNQFLTVAFITGLQIAISVQYVSLKGPFLETMIVENEFVYACIFNRKEFVVYLIYVMLLILICSLYSLTVRKEKKNMGEALFILISSWINIIVWIAWIAVMVTLSRDNIEPTICIGIIVCATVIVLSVFVPKLHKISKLKYDVKKSGMQNGGYKIDTDFMFERPHTLPGGFRTSYNFSPEKTNPRSITTFDSSMSY